MQNKTYREQKRINRLRKLWLEKVSNFELNDVFGLLRSDSKYFKSIDCIYDIKVTEINITHELPFSYSNKNPELGGIYLRDYVEIHGRLNKIQLTSFI